MRSWPAFRRPRWLRFASNRGALSVEHINPGGDRNADLRGNWQPVESADELEQPTGSGRVSWCLQRCALRGGFHRIAEFFVHPPGLSGCVGGFARRRLPYWSSLRARSCRPWALRRKSSRDCESNASPYMGVMVVPASPATECRTGSTVGRGRVGGLLIEPKLLDGDIDTAAAWRRNLGIITVVAVLALTFAPAYGKTESPKYLLLMGENRPVELTQADLDPWLSGATVVDTMGPAVRPMGAVDAISFWSEGFKTPEDRLAFARSELGRKTAGWWAADAAGGGTLVLRGDFTGGVSPLGPSQEVTYHSPMDLPHLAGVGGPAAASEHASSQRTSLTLAVAVLAVGAVAIAGFGTCRRLVR